MFKIVEIARFVIHPPIQKFLIKREFNSYSIHLRYAAMLSKFGKEIDFWKDIYELLDKAINANTPLCRLCLYFWCFCLW